MEEVKRWLQERSTPLLWVSGPVGCGKTTSVESEVLDLADKAVLRLSAFSPDDAMVEVGIGAKGEQFTTTVLLRFAMHRHVVILDGLDALQQTVGQQAGDIIDSRFAQLLLLVCGQARSSTSIIVTSRLGPPRLLPEASITVVNLLGTSDVRLPSLPAEGSIERRVLEFAALTRYAIDSAAIQRMSGIEEHVTLQALSGLTEGCIVRRVNGAVYQVPDWIRSSILRDATRTTAVRDAAVGALRQTETDPKLLLDLLVDDGNIADAVTVYWNLLGNFARLHYEGRDHFGAQLCRRLNDGLGPDEVSPNLSNSEGAWAVMNDWSQFARCCGDARTSALAAVAAYQVLPNDRPQWDAARLAAHAATGHLMAGNLSTAMKWCEYSWDHAREGMRNTEGIAVREVIEAYDESANTIAQIYLHLNNPPEIKRLIDDLGAIHQQGRQMIAEFNASSIIPLEGPSGEVTPEELIDGRLAAMLALAEGRFAEVGPLAESDAETPVGEELRTLLLRAEVSARRDEQADALLVLLRASAEGRDNCAAECELAVLAQMRLGSPDERLTLAVAYLPRAEACGLGMHWRDLQLVRSRALEDLGRRDEACSAAEEALFGTARMAGAYSNEDWTIVREAVGLLQSVGRKVPDQVLVDLGRSATPKRRSPPKAVERRAAPSSEGGAAARESMHTAALRVVARYENEGMPFVLYFRKFGIEVLHGPAELGRKLTENALRDALPAEVEVITIQDQRSQTYDLGSSRLRREAPALLLADEHWAEVARMLIPRADLIVSEPLMLSKGVRVELQMIYDACRWDRTVLVLPPQHSYLRMIDNDSLIQMFPRCVWADALHYESLTSSPLVADLLERIHAIARLPVETRRTFSELSARDKAYPVDLLAVAQHLETEAELGSVVFNQEDQARRYYAFWQMFRASAIRGVKYKQGDRSASNRCKLAHSYIEMSNIMLDHSKEGDRFILHGDPTEAKMLVQSAYELLLEADDDLSVRALRAQAEDQWETLLKVEQAMKEDPMRWGTRLLYGPLVLNKSQYQGT